MPKCWFVCWTFGHHPSCSWSCPCISSLTHLVFGMDALCFPCDMATGAALAGHHVPDQDVKHLQRRWRDCQCRIGPWTEQEDQALRKSVEKLGLQYEFGSDFWHWGCDKSDVVMTVSRPEWTNWWLRQRNIEGSRFPCGLLTHYIVLLCTSRNLIPKPELIFGNVLWMIHMYCHEAWFVTFVMVGNLRDKLGRKAETDYMETLELLGWRLWRHMIVSDLFHCWHQNIPEYSDRIW